MLDYIVDIDGEEIPKRINVDKNKNAHGDCFITFLKDNRSIILNGRITPENDDYTFVSNRGCSVPDYIICPVENLYNCTKMKTILVSDVINEFGFLPPKSIPDHSILSATFVTSFYDIGKNLENKNTVEKTTLPKNQNPKPTKAPKKNRSKINNQFFMSQEVLQQVLMTISKLENIVDTKDEINLLWAEIKAIFQNELNTLPDILNSNFKKQKNILEKVNLSGIKN